MIEIVLRKDIADYEPRPFFGFTARQVLTGAAIVAVSLATFALTTAVFHLPNTIAGYVILAAGAGVGALGLGRIRGLKPESWLRITLDERAFPRTVSYARPALSSAPGSVYDAPKPKLTRADKRALKRERLEYDPEDMEA